MPGRSHIKSIKILHRKACVQRACCILENKNAMYSTYVFDQKVRHFMPIFLKGAVHLGHRHPTPDAFNVPKNDIFRKLA